MMRSELKRPLSIGRLCLSLLLLVLSAAAGSAQELCTDTASAPYEPLPLIDLELGCALHPWTLAFDWNTACPQLPYLTATVGFRCEECGRMGPLRSLSATGYGDCSEYTLSYCEPLLKSITYGAADVQIRIQNKILNIVCYNNGYSQAWTFCNCPACSHSPILISLEGASLSLTDVENGVLFDLAATGTAKRTAWTARDSDEAFLVLDRNENGLVDDGTELFGDATPQTVADPAERNGFAALAVFDDALSGGNEDGLLDAEDDIFWSLRLWLDANHDGISQVGELSTLAAAEIEAIHLRYQSASRMDRHGNELRYMARVDRKGGTSIAWDVFFLD